MESKKQQDVTIEVTGVAMSGEADINEHNRPIKSDKEETEGEKSWNSTRYGWRSHDWFQPISQKRRGITGIRRVLWYYRRDIKTNR